MHYLKSKRVCLSAIFCLWNVSSKCSAIDFILTIAKETYFHYLRGEEDSTVLSGT